MRSIVFEWAVYELLQTSDEGTSLKFSMMPIFFFCMATEHMQAQTLQSDQTPPAKAKLNPVMLQLDYTKKMHELI